MSVSSSLRFLWIWPMGSMGRRREAGRREKPGYLRPFPQLCAHWACFGSEWLHSLVMSIAPINQPLSDAAALVDALLFPTQARDCNGSLLQLACVSPSCFGSLYCLILYK